MQEFPEMWLHCLGHHSAAAALLYISGCILQCKRGAHYYTALFRVRYVDVERTDLDAIGNYQYHRIPGDWLHVSL